MKALSFLSTRVTPEISKLAAVLSKLYSVCVVSPQEYVSRKWDYTIVCDDYSLFVQIPIQSEKVFIWKTMNFKHPSLAGIPLGGSPLLSNLVCDGIVKSCDSIDGEGEVVDTPRKWVALLDGIPLEDVPYPIVGLRCNWTKTLKEDWAKLVPPEFPCEIVNGDGEVSFIFNGCDRFPHEGDVITTMEPECNRGHISPVWRSKPRSIQRNMIEWHLSLKWDEVEKPVAKSKVLSAIVSGENRLEGHQKRLALVKYLDDTLQFDLYGRHPHQLKNYKGGLPVKDPGMLPYKYHIAVENCRENGYFTEKIVDGILAECLCFYWGCPDIDKYIDPRAFIPLPLDSPEECLKIITNAIANNEWEKRLKYIQNEKWRVLNGWSIFPTIRRYIEKTLPDLNHVIYILNPPERFEEWVRVTKKMVGKPYRRIETLAEAPSGAVIVEDIDI
jgi:hypothetical protein